MLASFKTPSQPVASGLKWRRVDGNPPKGTKLDNDALSGALKKLSEEQTAAELAAQAAAQEEVAQAAAAAPTAKPPAAPTATPPLEFSQIQWDKFNVVDLRYDDYIQADASYFQPDAEGFKLPDELDLSFPEIIDHMNATPNLGQIQNPNAIASDIHKAYDFVNADSFNAVQGEFKKMTESMMGGFKNEGDTSETIYAARMDFPADAKVICIGDIHSGMIALVSALQALIENNYIDNSGLLQSGVYLIFLGDLVDRGLYGLEVLFVVMQLAIKEKNRGRVIVLNGNHEEKSTYEGYGFAHEVRSSSLCAECTDTDLLPVDEMLRCLPAVLFATLRGRRYQFCHGGIVFDESMVKKINLWYSNPYSTMTFVGAFTDSEGKGWLWNDFDVLEWITSDNITRGGDTKVVGSKDLVDYLSNTSIVLIVRGHEDKNRLRLDTASREGRRASTTPVDEKGNKDVIDIKCDVVTTSIAHPCKTCRGYNFETCPEDYFYVCLEPVERDSSSIATTLAPSPSSPETTPASDHVAPTPGPPPTTTPNASRVGPVTALPPPPAKTPAAPTAKPPAAPTTEKLTEARMEMKAAAPATSQVAKIKYTANKLQEALIHACGGIYREGLIEKLIEEMENVFCEHMGLRSDGIQTKELKAEAQTVAEALVEAEEKTEAEKEMISAALAREKEKSAKALAEAEETAMVERKESSAELAKAKANAEAQEAANAAALADIKATAEAQKAANAAELARVQAESIRALAEAEAKAGAEKAASDEAEKAKNKALADAVAVADALRIKLEKCSSGSDASPRPAADTSKLGGDEEEELMKSYLGALKDILQLRRQGKSNQPIFETYNEALAALPDSKVKEMYKKFMLVYLEEADADTLELMGLKPEEVNDNVLGFAEMMTIKLGETIDQPRHVRMQAIQNERNRKAEQEKARLETEELERKNFEKLAAMRAEVEQIYEETIPAIRELANGEGEFEVAEQRRLERSGELKLLLKTAPELKQLSNYQWQAMSSSGLRRAEIACLIHVLSQKSSPAQSQPFLQLLEKKLANMPKDGEEAPPPRPLPLPKGGRPPMLVLEGMEKRRLAVGSVNNLAPKVDEFEAPAVPMSRMSIQRSTAAAPKPPIPDISDGGGAVKPPPLPPPVPLPPPIPPGAVAPDTSDDPRDGDEDAGSMLRMQIEAQRRKREERAKAIERGEIQVVDPREARERALKEQKSKARMR